MAGVVATEGAFFAYLLFAYFYLASQSTNAWPAEAPRLPLPLLNTAILLASCVPNWYTKHAAERLDLHKVRVGLVWCNLFGLAFIAVRALEFGALNTRWDSDAYGSAVWMLMGLHTLHLVTDAYDTLVLTVLMFRGPLEGKRFVDVAENAGYWYFVVVSWLAIYAVVYFGARY
jgi:heme/copper-type cytochrome/quinol oxidase subunit 3